ncbi:metalloprotease [Mycena belliarum]|uniref:Metalloprotease n=1 Tax=Mycena belliarum TaxID=1033014 RepID=A0AAD6UJR5_9AGAR|nr:metalloprotease [Mycena belliae]
MLYPTWLNVFLFLGAAGVVLASPLEVPEDHSSVGLPSAKYATHPLDLWCGTVISRDDILSAENAMKESPAGAASPSEINVYWTVVSKDGTVAGGDISTPQIVDQMQELNNNYGGSFTWTLAGISRVVNAEWHDEASPNTPQQTAMKTAHRQGGRRDLNVYTVGFVSGPGKGLLGYATFPSSYGKNPTDDGVVIHFATLPGGSMTHYNLGRTLSHEAGHWLGLYHTFQGGCAQSSGGDFVSDTPAESSPTSGCPNNKTSCSPGVQDPIHNYMDYSYDSCMDQFTAGQMERAASQMNMYRPN